MSNLGNKLAILGFFSLFFLSKTPAAIVTSHHEPAIFEAVASSAVIEKIPSLEKIELSPLKQSSSRVTSSSASNTSRSSNSATGTNSGSSSTSNRGASSASNSNSATTSNSNSNSASLAATPSGSYISITGNNISIFDAKQTNGVLDETGTRVGVYKNRFYYGHNYASVFGKLYNNLKVGDTFTITKNGQTATYVVKAKEVFVKKGDLQNADGTSTALFRDIYKAKLNGVQHDISIMTCHGQQVGKSDATHRLVIMADQIK